VRSAYVARQFVYNYFKNLEMEEEAVSSIANKGETLGSSIN
jgi:hypothetical protein